MSSYPAADESGKRRATPIAEPSAPPFGHDFAEHPLPQNGAYPKPMLNDALELVDDRLDRLEHVLGDLNGVVMRAGAQLSDLLTGGTYSDLDVPPHDPPTEATPEDTRSTIARKVAGKAQRTDRLTDAVVAIRIRLEAILDASEV